MSSLLGPPDCVSKGFSYQLERLINNQFILLQSDVSVTNALVLG